MSKYDLLVISSYREKGETHGKRTVGVASYTKNLLEELAIQNPEFRMYVMAEYFEQQSIYREDTITVERAWKRKDIGSIVKAFVKAGNMYPEHILISFEAYMFGSLFHNIATLIGLAWLKIKGKPVSFMLHQVLVDFHTIEKNWLKATILNVAKDIFYGLIKALSSQVIVFEKQLKTQLGSHECIQVLPHLVEKPAYLSKKEAREKLGWNQNKKYALYFGFISYYKGVDWLLSNWPQDSGYELVIAGGINHNHLGVPKMERFYNKILKTSKRKNIPITGFVAESDIKYYYAASDIVVLPYTMFFSSSGPLAIAFSYGKPILLSNELEPYKYSADFQAALEKSNLEFSDILFYFQRESLKRALKRVATSYNKMESFSKKMRRLRTRWQIARQLRELLLNKECLELTKEAYFERLKK